MANVSSEAIEKVLISGDLSKLDPDQRLWYYNNLCESLGLNPLTRPFEYLLLNGKLVMYARKDATDQLRKIHSVSVDELIHTSNKDLGVYVVTAKGHSGNRTDVGTGAVALLYPEKYKDRNGTWTTHPKAGTQLVGDDLANVIMKCESKAKRRLTLSICGLGLMDETEIETAVPEYAPPAPPRLELPSTTAAMTAPVSASVQENAVAANAVELKPKTVRGRKPVPKTSTTVPEVSTHSPSPEFRLSESINKSVAFPFGDNLPPAPAEGGSDASPEPPPPFVASDDDVPDNIGSKLVVALGRIEKNIEHINNPITQNASESTQIALPTEEEYQAYTARLRKYADRVGFAPLKPFVFKIGKVQGTRGLNKASWNAIFAVLDSAKTDAELLEKIK